MSDRVAPAGRPLDVEIEARIREIAPLAVLKQLDQPIQFPSLVSISPQKTWMEALCESLLLLCVPHPAFSPSLDGLRNIFVRKMPIPVDAKTTAVATGMMQFMEMIEGDIMAWATGTPPPPVWCEHISRRYSKSKLRNRWFFRQGTAVTGDIVVEDTWTACPICAAPRPSEAR